MERYQGIEGVPRLQNPCDGVGIHVAQELDHEKARKAVVEPTIAIASLISSSAGALLDLSLIHISEPTRPY